MTSNDKLAADIKKFFKDSDEYKNIHGGTDLFKEVGLNSIQLVSFITYREHLRRAKIDVADVTDEKIRTIDNIIWNYF